MKVFGNWLLSLVVFLVNLDPLEAACNEVFYMEMKRELTPRKQHVSGTELREIESELEKLILTLGSDHPETKFHFWQQLEQLEKFKNSHVPNMSQNNRYFLVDILDLTNRRHLISDLIEGLRKSKFIEPSSLRIRVINYLHYRSFIPTPSAPHIEGPESGVILGAVLKMFHTYSPSTRELRYAIWRQACEILGKEISQPDLEFETEHFVFQLVRDINNMHLTKAWIDGLRDLSPFDIPTL